MVTLPLPSNVVLPEASPPNEMVLAVCSLTALFAAPPAEEDPA